MPDAQVPPHSELTETVPAIGVGARIRWLALGALPLALLGVVLAVILATNAGIGKRSAPPIEQLNIQSVTLPHPGMLTVNVINDGPDPITIAQVTVDDAYWHFEINGERSLRRLQSATIDIPYPWVEGEAHAVGIVTSTGLVFHADIPVAMESPHRDGETLSRFALIGFYVGIVPVTLGLLWYPFLRRLGRGGMRFILALTIGLLLFLAVDMFGEAQEVAASSPGSFKGPLLIPGVALLTFLGMSAFANRKRGEHENNLEISYRIALGIGLHNLAEGLAIGAAFALGEVALGVFLVIGFTLHNVTEGIGIAAPILRNRPAIRHFVWLAALGGGPAILGVWIGGFFYSPLAATVFLAVGIGAIAQVVVDVSRLLTRGRLKSASGFLSWATLSGLTSGMGVMYLTALVVSG